jgi:alpha-mannosidase
VQNTYFGRVFAPRLNSLSTADFRFEPAKPGEAFEAITIDGNKVETPFYIAFVNEHGEIVSLIDKRTPEPREVIKPGERANRLSFYEDRPLNWDAWDIDEYYREFPLEEPETIVSRWVEKGPVRCSLVTIKKFRNSSIMQHIFFYTHTPAIDFETLVDWHDKNILIKASFPVNVNSDEAYYEIPFGYVKRSTLTNRPHERAMFETPAMRWSALYETGYGAALINDSKYAYSNHDSTLELTLLKSAVHPDPDAEEGSHRFTYTLLPCISSQPDSELIAKAAVQNLNGMVFNQTDELNNSGTDTEGGRVCKDEPFYVKSEKNHIILETIKPGEDNKSIILRLYESLNMRGSAEVFIPSCFIEAKEVNMLEDEIPDSVSDEIIKETNAGKIKIHFKPFEIKTIRLVQEI